MTDNSAKAGHSLWGGRFSAKPDAIMQAINVSIGFDRRLAAEDIAGSRAHAAMLAAAGIIAASDAAAIQEGLTAIEAEMAAGTFPVPRRIRGHSHECGGPPFGAHRTGGRASAYGALAQRPGGAGFPAVGARGLRRGDRPAEGPAAGPDRQGRGACRGADAGIHPPAVGPAGHLRPSPDGLCGDVRPRRRTLCRRPRADERVARSAPRPWPEPRFPSTGR